MATKYNGQLALQLTVAESSGAEFEGPLGLNEALSAEGAAIKVQRTRATDKAADAATEAPCTRSSLATTVSAFDIEDEPDMVHVIPISGGADSSALALWLHEAFPHIAFRMMMTDTGAEDASTYEFLKTIETLTGTPIEIVKATHDLWELVAKYNGYLPSGQSRWCTRELKLVPYQKWMRQFNGRPMTMYVGIRADEASRLAFDIEGVETVMPFKEMGWGREQVFAYLSRKAGIPRQYETRTRSGCTVCPFVRRQEVVGLLQRNPTEFDRGRKLEKLSPADQARHGAPDPLWQDVGIAPNWLSLQTPSREKAASAKLPQRAQADPGLFGTTGVFAAAEFFMDSFPGMEPFIWHQRFISYSPALHTMKRQVDDRYQHLLRTAEVYEMTPEDVRRNAKFVVYYVELDDGVMDVTGPVGKSYTWQSGQSYAQVRHITDWVTRVLQGGSLSLQAKTPARSELSVEHEWQQSAIAGMAALRESGKPAGQIVHMDWYQPKEEERELSAEEAILLVPCPMCHI